MKKDPYLDKLQKLFVNRIYLPDLRSQLPRNVYLNVMNWRSRVSHGKKIEEETMRRFLTEYCKVKFKITA